jgi:short-subunit dehydrogenase
MIPAVCFPICPGAVATDMMDNVLKDDTFEFPPEIVLKSVDESVEHVLARIDEGTRERNVLVQWDGQVIPW